MSNSILIVGGGFSGITTALEAAEVGYETYIVEKNPYLGGRVAQLNQYFPKLCPPSCGLEIQFQRIRKSKVRYYTMAEVVSVSGTKGNYDVTVKIKPRYVNENCTACGECANVCETMVESEFDFGMGMHKAAYLTHPFAFPMRYVIDKERCSQEELQKMAEVCKYDAIDLEEEERTIELNVGSIVWATGWKPYDVTKLTTLGSGKVPNVISNMQMERLAAPNGPTGGKILRPFDGQAPKKVAFVQCAGSRDRNHLDYCSYICCMASLKQAMYVREQYPDAKVTIFYIDLRTPGKYEKFLNKVEADEKVSFVKGKVAEVNEGKSGEVLVTYEDAMAGTKQADSFDMVVLATGMEPSVCGQDLPVEMVQDANCFLEDNSGAGIYAAGCAKNPLDVMTSAESATGAALKSIQTLVGGKE
ncbi:MAG: FAD-dependent oxidoreductase [Desulfovibrionales bacterium]